MGGRGFGGRWSETIFNSSISYNTAPDGGGVSVAGGVLELGGSHVMNNQATGATGRGGGIYVTEAGSISLANSTNVNANTGF